ncbi:MULTISPECIES: hypothetical protein [Cupriavidus]
MNAATPARRGVPDATPATPYRQAKAHIARQIQSRAWQPGDRVPCDQIGHMVNAISAAPERAAQLEMPGHHCLLLRLGSRFRADGSPAFG